MTRPTDRSLPLALAVFCLLVGASGCDTYGTVSPTAYEYAKALYSISNRQADDKLDGVEQQIIASSESGDLHDDEAEWLRAIVEHCRQGQWKLASQESRQIMEEQVH